MNGGVAPVPDHVPAELIRDFDFFAFPGSDRDVHLAWKSIQKEPPLFWTPRNGGHWVATRGRDIETIYGDSGRFSSRTESLPRDAAPFRQPPVEMDPPEHQDYRRIITPEFSPRAMAGLEQRARDLTIQLIAGFRDQGGCEFIRAFAKHMPIGIFLSVMKLPAEDAERLVPLAETKTRTGDVAVSYDVHRQVLDYIAEKVEERRRNPGDDLISRTLAAEIDGRRLRDEEVLAMCAVVMFAGLDTVVSSLGFIMRFLAENPAHRADLRNAPGLIPNAVDEMLRRFSPTNLAREAKADMVFGGVELKARDPILLPTCLHGLDEHCWERPLVVDFQRRPILHLAFGTGAHRCIGSLLARTELRVMLSEWLPLIPEFEISPDMTVTTQSGQVNAVTSLPLSWAVN